MTWKNEPQRHSLSARGIPTSFGKLQKFHNPIEENIPPIPDWDDLTFRDESGAVYDGGVFGDQYVCKEMNKAIQLFWWSSITDNWDYFDFDRFYNNVAPYIIDRTGSSIPDVIIDSIYTYIDEEASEKSEGKYKAGEMVGFLDPKVLGLSYDYMSRENYDEISEYINETFNVKNYENRVLPKDYLDILTAVLDNYDTSGREVLLSLSAPQIYMDMLKWSFMNRNEKINLIDKIIDLQHVRGNLWGSDIESLRKDFEREYL